MFTSFYRKTKKRECSVPYLQLSPAHCFVAKTVIRAAQNTETCSNAGRVGYAQLLNHLDLDDMRRSTEHRFLFEPAVSPTAMAAAAAAAAALTTGSNRSSFMRSSGSKAGQGSGTSRARSASRVSVARRVSVVPKASTAVERVGAGTRRTSSVGVKKQDKARQDSQQRIEQQQPQQQQKQQQHVVASKEPEDRGETKNASVSRPDKGSVAAAPKAAEASMPPPLVLKAVPEDYGSPGVSPSGGGGASVRSGMRSNRSGSSR